MTQETTIEGPTLKHRWGADALDSARRQLPVTVRLVHLEWIPVAAIAASLIIWKMKLAGDAAELVLGAAIAIAVSPTLADRAAVTLAASPTSRSRRVAARLVLILPVAVICWFFARVLAAHPLPESTPLSSFSTWIPGREAWMIFAVLTSLVLGIEAMATKSGGIAGLAGSSTVFVVCAIAITAPPSIALLPVAAHWSRWGTALVASFAAFAVVLHDPGRARRHDRSRLTKLPRHRITRVRTAGSRHNG